MGTIAKCVGFCLFLLCGLLADRTALGDAKVLSGLPDFRSADVEPGDPRPVLTDSPDFTTATLRPEDGRPANAANPLGSTPEYVWWYGCTPTAAGMLVAYWDAQAGRENLYKKGDSQVWSGDGTTGTKRMVASQGHINQNSAHNLAGCSTASDKSLACFLKTDPVTGGTYYVDIAPGLEQFIEWDDTSAYDMKDGYQATVGVEDVGFWNTPGQAFTYGDLKAEIDAGRPMLLDLMTYYNGWWGHSVVAYGYQDDMFQIKVPVGGGLSVNLTVGGFAVRDTWANGTAQSNWYDWSGAVVYPVIANGVEWWPFVELQGSSYTARWDWMLSDGVSLYVAPVPEPATLLLLALGGLGLLARRVQRKGFSNCG